MLLENISHLDTHHVCGNYLTHPSLGRLWAALSFSRVQGLVFLKITLLASTLRFFDFSWHGIQLWIFFFKVGKFHRSLLILGLELWLDPRQCLGQEVSAPWVFPLLSGQVSTGEEGQ